MSERVRLTADIPAEATLDEARDIRAGAIQAALMLGATDPKMRTEMIVGETRQEWRHFVERLARKLEGEPEPLRQAVLDMMGREMRPMWEDYFPLKQVKRIDAV